MEQNVSTSHKTSEPVFHEGSLTKAIEKQTAQIPSIVYLGLAVGSIALSAGLAMNDKRKNLANFVGLWVPTLLLLGIYNKIVKVEGSDQSEKARMLH